MHPCFPHVNLLSIKQGTRLLIDFACHGFVIVFFMLILDKDLNSFSSLLPYIFFKKLGLRSQIDRIILPFSLSKPLLHALDNLDI